MAGHVKPRNQEKWWIQIGFAKLRIEGANLQVRHSLVETKYSAPRLPPVLLLGKIPTVDGSGIRRAPADMQNITIFYTVS